MPAKVRRGPGQGGVYRRRGSRVWYMKFVPPGHTKPVRESTGRRNKSEALAVLHERLREVEEWGFDGSQVQRTTLRQLADLHLEDFASRGRKTATRIGEHHARLFEFFGERCRVVTLTTPRIREYKLWRLGQRSHKGGAITLQTVKNELATLRRMMNLGYQETPPLVRRVPSFPTISVRRRESGFYHRYEIDQIAADLRAEGMLHNAFFVEFQFLTGWRPGEAKALLRENVDVDKGYLRVPDSKTGEPIDLCVGAYGPLMALLRDQDAYTQSCEERLGREIETFFHQPDGRPIGSYRTMWDGVHERLELEQRRFYDLRATAIREMRRAGLSKDLAKMLSRHKSDAAFDHYWRHDPKVMDMAYAQLGAHHEKAALEERVVSIRSKKKRSAHSGAHPARKKGKSSTGGPVST